MGRVKRWLGDMGVLILAVGTLAGIFWLCTAAGDSLTRSELEQKERVRLEEQACHDRGGFIVHQYRSDDLCVDEHDGHIIKYREDQ